MTIFGFSIYAAVGDRLVDHCKRGSWGVQVCAGSLLVYLGPIHMILDRV